MHPIRAAGSYPPPPPQSNDPHPFFQLFPETNGICEIVFLCLLAPIYLVARLIKYLFFDDNAPELPHQWKESFREALDYAQRDARGGLSEDELVLCHSLLDNLLNSIPDEVIYHPPISTELAKLEDLQLSILTRLGITYTDETGGGDPRIARLFHNRGDVLNDFSFEDDVDQGEIPLELPSDDQINRINRAIKERYDLIDENYNGLEKEAILVMIKNVLPSLFALPTNKLIELQEAFADGDAALYDQFFPNLIPYLWLKGDLKAAPLTGVKPTLLNYLINDSPIRKKLALIAWANQKNYTFSERSSLFSPSLTSKGKEVDLLLTDICKELLLDPPFATKVAEYKRSPNTAIKRALWNQIEANFEKFQPSWSIRNRMAQLDPDHKEAIAHAKLITELRDETKSELSRFLAGASQITSHFRQGNNRFCSSLAAEVVQAPLMVQFGADINNLATHLKTNPNPSQKNLEECFSIYRSVNFADPTNQNKLLILGWSTLIKRDSKISKAKLEPFLEALSNCDFKTTPNLHQLFFLSLNQLLDLKKITPKQKAFDREIAELGKLMKKENMPLKTPLENLGKICKIDFSQESSVKILLSLTRTLV